ncbi:MAG TPA: hypothetical protein VNY29_10420, partial [Terriglobales bacterium]|nr:hypothetical protein [Terriglobales bacterium]
MSRSEPGEASSELQASTTRRLDAEPQRPAAPCRLTSVQAAAAADAGRDETGSEPDSRAAWDSKKPVAHRVAADAEP